MNIKEQIEALKKESGSTKVAIDKLTEAVNLLAKSFDGFNVAANRQEIAGTADLSKVREPSLTGIGTTGTIPEMDSEINLENVDPNKIPIPPAWRKMVDDILGVEFGIDVVYPQQGSGFLFKIIVPKEKSNASPAHQEFYKVDIRTKAIAYNEGISGVENFCQKVAKNLGIVKRNK